VTATTERRPPQFERCLCGHRRLEHSRPRGVEDQVEPEACIAEACYCTRFRPDTTGPLPGFDR